MIPFICALDNHRIFANGSTFEIEYDEGRNTEILTTRGEKSLQSARYETDKTYNFEESP